MISPLPITRSLHGPLHRALPRKCHAPLRAIGYIYLSALWSFPELSSYSDPPTLLDISPAGLDPCSTSPMNSVDVRLQRMTPNRGRRSRTITPSTEFAKPFDGSREPTGRMRGQRADGSTFKDRALICGRVGGAWDEHGGGLGSGAMLNHDRTSAPRWHCCLYTPAPRCRPWYGKGWPVGACWHAAGSVDSCGRVALTRAHQP